MPGVSHRRWRRGVFFLARSFAAAMPMIIGDSLANAIKMDDLFAVDTSPVTVHWYRRTGIGGFRCLRRQGQQYDVPPDNTQPYT